MLNFVFSLSILAIIYSVNAQQCSNLGSLQVFNDPTCSNGGGAGCNAGGQGLNCRFCGFDVFPPCPSTATTQAATKPSTNPTTKGSTTTKSTTTRDPNITRPTATGIPANIVTEEYIEEDDTYPGERLIFHDDFSKLNLKKWKHDLTMSGGGNWEFQLYHNNRTNSYIEDGVFYIKPTLTAERIGEANLKSNYRMDMWGGSPADRCTGNGFYGCERTSGAGGNILNPIQSAKITTAESFGFTYGRVEVRAKLPRGDWLWPAIWMLPVRNEYGMWPASGEIDIMESRGNLNYPASAGGGVESFGSTLHWGTDWSQNRYLKTTSVYAHPTPLSDDFHTYGLHWTKERLYTYIDDPSNVVLDIDMTQQSFFEFGEFASSYENPWRNDEINAPFNRDFYLIINLAVGGTAGYFPDNVGGKPWSDKSSNSVNEFYNAKDRWYPTWQNEDVTFQIDSVKVWSFDE